MVRSIDTPLKITMFWLIVVLKSSLESDRHGVIAGLVLRLEFRGEVDPTTAEVRMEEVGVGVDQIEDVMIATGEVEEIREMIGVSERLDFC